METIKATVVIPMEIEIPKEILNKCKTVKDKRRLFGLKALLLVRSNANELHTEVTNCSQDLSIQI
jgi:hypothetical protein